MDVKPRAPLPADVKTLPARYYTDPDLFRVEMERLFARRWVAAGRAGEIPTPGAYVVRDIAGESVIVTRDADHTLRAFYNVCRHRGTRLCAPPHGHLAGAIQCPYHAWTYALDGSLVGAPHMDDVDGFRREDYPLHRVGIDEWDGHIFVNLSDAEGGGQKAEGGGRAGSLEPARGAKPPSASEWGWGPASAEKSEQRVITLREQLGSLPDKFRPWRMEELRLAKRIVYNVNANWKLIVLNYSECLHCPVIHPVLNRLSFYMSGENEPLQPTYMGGRMDLRDGVETMSIDGKCRRACLPHVRDEDRTRVYYYAIFPNLLLTLHPDYMMTHTLWPRACDRTEIVCEWHFHPDQMAAPDFGIDDVVEFWDVTNRQDWRVSELAQLGIGSRAYTPGPYSYREDLLYAFDRFIERTLADDIAL